MTLEKLLNILISMGWQPWGFFKTRRLEANNARIYILLYEEWHEQYSLNDLCSISSWLWQFVVEKELVNDSDSFVWDNKWTPVSEEYRLMEAAIQGDKSRFLLENIELSE